MGDVPEWVVENDEPSGLATDPVTEAVIDSVVPHYVPPRSLALYARWWQLETWLRELAYVELRAQHGTQWADAVKGGASRKKTDAAFVHMHATDNDNPLAYLDYSQLVELLDENSSLFGYALLEPNSWKGRQPELRQIRHRIGHLRRPHADDLERLEQTLRDLERGAFIAMASYNRRDQPSVDQHHDAVTDGWLRGRHPTARRLIAHADRQYETRIVVRASRRPWATWPANLDGAPGLLWHADFFVLGRWVDPRALWNDYSLARVRKLAIHLVADDPHHLGFTFAAVDGADVIADAIGEAFDAVLMVARYGSIDEDSARWKRRVRDVDFRVLHGTGWNVVDETTVPISNFAAGGGIEAAPHW